MLIEGATMKLKHVLSSLALLVSIHVLSSVVYAQSQSTSGSTFYGGQSQTGTETEEMNAHNET